MAKSIGFNITLNVNGKDTIVKCKADAQNLSRTLGQVKSQSDIARSSAVKWSAASTATKNAYEGFPQVANAMTSYILLFLHQTATLFSLSPVYKGNLHLMRNKKTVV